MRDDAGAALVSTESAGQNGSGPPQSVASTEEFWADLLAFIDDGTVLPVVGAELLALSSAAGPVPLYRAVAERLLARYGLTAMADDQSGSSGPEARAAGQGIRLRATHELNDAVVALAKMGRRIGDLYRPVNEILRRVLQESPLDLTPLHALAQIGPFDLFVSTTIDSSLVHALDTVRHEGRPETVQIEFAPNLPGDHIRDIPPPEGRPPGYSMVFHLFGQASNAPLFAIHDEDVLEFVYTLQAILTSGREHLSSEIRNRHLLLIGCNFTGWLSRFFLRIYSGTRLSGDRMKKEFLADHMAAADGELTVFLERFSQNTRLYPLDARAFIAELSRRWAERHPVPAGGPPTPGPSRPHAVLSSAPTAIFVSYAGNDLAAAKQLYADLHELGGDVVWFDKSTLRAGDNWKQEILAAIRRCALFVPLISRQTETRTDGVFRLEWDLAVERAREIQGRRFIIPVVIDADYAGDAERYRLVPEKFRDMHFGRAPAGRLLEPLLGEFRDELRALRRVRCE